MVMRSLESIHAKFGTSVIIVEQNVNLALAMVERAIILKTGKMVVDSPSAELRAANRLWEWF
jgi:ABC-type branched-subunit amino acid transport system ATPase component